MVVAGGHISRRTEIVFAETYLGVESNSYMQSIQEIPVLVMEEMR